MIFYLKENKFKKYKFDLKYGRKRRLLQNPRDKRRSNWCRDKISLQKTCTCILVII